MGKFKDKWEKLSDERQYEYIKMILRDWGYWIRNIIVLIFVILIIYFLII